MGKKLVIAVALLFVTAIMLAQSSSIGLLKKMHTRFRGTWYQTFSFNQTTEIYRNDSLVRLETWYENIKFPDKFRIDFGNPDSANAVIFRSDSSYLFKKSKLVRVAFNNDDLLFLLGGMYFYSFDTVIAKMNLFGYDLNKFHEDTWKGTPVYMVGADKNEDSVNQVWIEKINYRPLRMLRYENSSKEEAMFENHVKLKGGFTETLVYFYINGRLIQVEKYHDLKGNVPINDAIFDPQNFIKIKL